MTTEPVEPAPSLVHRLLAAFVGGVCRRPRTVLALALLLCAVSAALAATRLSYRTQRSDLISPDKDCQRRLRQFLAEFGSDDDMVVVVQGEDRARMQAALDAVAQRIEERPDQFTRLFYRVDLRPLRNRALLFLPADQVRQVHDGLEPMRPLLSLGPGAWQHFTLSSLLQAAQFKAMVLKPQQALSPADTQFFGQLSAICGAADATLADPTAYRSPWGSLMPQAPGGQSDQLAEPQYFFSGDNKLAFLLAQPVQEEGSFTAARTSVETLRAILDQLRPAFPDLRMGLTGLPVLENDEMVASQRDTETASWLALAAVAVLYLIVFRGLYYPLLTYGTLLVGIAWALGWLTLTVGHLNILSATFAIMLIAMGDYGVLWVTRYEQARRSGMEVRAALIHTATHVAVGNLTAATALALAFFAAMFADFQAVAELGWIAGCGVLWCAAACFTVLPAALMIFDRRRISPDPAVLPLATYRNTSSETAGWLPRLTSRPRTVIVGTLILTALVAAGITRLGYDHNLLRLQGPGLDSVRWQHVLIRHTEGANWYALSATNTPEEALALKARYERLPAVSRVVEVASLVPRDQEYKITLLQKIHALLERLPESGSASRRATPDAAELRRGLGALARRLEALPGVPLLAELRGRLVALEQRLAKLPPAEAGERLRAFEDRLTGSLADDLRRLRDVSTPAPITLADLPEPLRQRFIGATGKWLVRIFARDSLWEYEPLAQFAQQIEAVDSEASGKPFGTVEGLKSLKEGFQRAGLYALLVIVGVLVLDFRHLGHALIAVAPLALGLVLSLGLLGLFGLSLNPANMIALPLILGVGVDNGVHVLHDYLLRRREGCATISQAIGRGVLLKAVTTMIGFGTLMVSSHRGLFGLGLILTLGVACCMLTALVFLPAVLRLLGGQAAPEVSPPQRLGRAA